MVAVEICVIANPLHCVPVFGGINAILLPIIKAKQCTSQKSPTSNIVYTEKYCIKTINNKSFSHHLYIQHQQFEIEATPALGCEHGKISAVCIAYECYFIPHYLSNSSEPNMFLCLPKNLNYPQEARQWQDLSIAPSQQRLLSVAKLPSSVFICAVTVEVPP